MKDDIASAIVYAVRVVVGVEFVEDYRKSKKRSGRKSERVIEQMQYR
jgi:hypothetical protein